MPRSHRPKRATCSPSALRRRLSGDLDNIVLKAMAQGAGRGATPRWRQLSEDIRRHLEGRPVLARKPTLRYSASKFVTRNKALVAAAALAWRVALAGRDRRHRVAGARRAEASASEAERRFNDVRKLANSFMFELHDAIRDLPGPPPPGRCW